VKDEEAKTNKTTTSDNEPTILAKDKATQEREAWDLVKNSSDAEDFRFFLKEFPIGANSEKAKIRLEEIVWSSVKASDDKAKIQSYLKEFPNGSNASSARIKLRKLEAADTQINENDFSINLEGQYWTCETSNSGFSKISFRFLRGGRLVYRNITANKEFNDDDMSWQQTDNKVHISWGDNRSIIWDGVITKNRIEGTASTKVTKWTWTCTQVLP
jgi:hypothetical protein